MQLHELGFFCHRWLQSILLATVLISAPAFAQITVPPGGSLSIPAGGTLALGCTNLNVQGNLSLGSGSVDQGATVDIAATGSVNSGQGTINAGVGWNNAGTFDPGTSTVVIDDACGIAQFLFTGRTTFYNLVIRSTVGRTFVIPAGLNLTVLGTLTLQGAPGLPIQLVSSNASPATIALGSNARVVSSNATFSPSVQTMVLSANNIPTLNDYGLIATALLLLMATARVFRRKLK